MRARLGLSDVVTVNIRLILDGTATYNEDGSVAVQVAGVLPPLPLPSKVLGLTTSAITDDLVTLVWLDNGDAATWLVYRDDVFLAEVGSPTYTDNTVNDDTDYVYHVVAENREGDGPASDDLLVHTVLETSPNIPQNIRYSPEDGGQSVEFLQLEWDNPGTVLTWTIFRDSVEIATVSTPFYRDDAVVPETEYLYEIVANNATGTSAPGSFLAETLENTLPVWDGDTVMPFAPFGVPYAFGLAPHVDDADGQSLTFSLQGGSLPTGLAINGPNVTGTPTQGGSFAPVFGVSDGFDLVTKAWSLEVEAAPDTTGPTTPQISVSANGSTVTIALTTLSTDATGVARYNIQRSSNGVNFSFLDSIFPPATELVDPGTPNGTWYYRCRAEDSSPAANLSLFSDIKSVVVSTLPLTPDVPINFTAIKNANGDGTNISWAAGPNGAAPTGYDLEFSIQADGGSASGPWTNFVVSGAVTSANHSALPTGRVWYRIRAENNGTFSAYTSVIFVDIGSQVGSPNFRITSGTTFNGSTLRTDLQNPGGPQRAVRAGDIIEFDAGLYRGFVFSNIVGTLANPVVVRPPATGQVLFRNLNPSTGGFLVREENCHGVVFDGFTTDPAIPVQRDGKRHGFKCMYASNSELGAGGNKEGITAYVKHKGTSSNGNPPYNNTDKVTHRYWHVDGGWDLNLADSFADHLGGQIAFDSNDNAYALDTGANSDGQIPLGTWQESMIWEHILVENIGGEGTYVGGNPYSSYKLVGGSVHQHIPVRYVKLRHFYFYNTGGQAVQFKSIFGGQGGADAPTDNSCHDGVIIRSTMLIDAATNGTPAIVCNSSKVDVYNIWFEDCNSNVYATNVSDGTNVNFPAGESTNFTQRIYNCVAVDCGTGGGSANAFRVSAFTGGSASVPTLPAAFRPTTYLFCNTILRYGGGNAIEFTSGANAASRASNNIIVGASGIAFGPTTNDGSNITGLTQSAVFVDPVGSIEDGDIDLRLLVARLATGAIAPAGTQPTAWPASTRIPNFSFGGTPGDGSRTATNPDAGAYEL